VTITVMIDLGFFTNNQIKACKLNLIVVGLYQQKQVHLYTEIIAIHLKTVLLKQTSKAIIVVELSYWQ